MVSSKTFLLLLFFIHFNAAFYSKISHAQEKQLTSKKLIYSSKALSNDKKFSANLEYKSLLFIINTFGGDIQYNFSLAEKWHMGVNAGGRLLTPFQLSESIVLFNAGTSVSYGNDDLLFNFSLNLQTAYDSFSDLSDLDRFVFLPSLGLNKRINSTSMFMLEYVHGGFTNALLSDSKQTSIEVGALMFGYRFGQRLYGEFNLVFAIGINSDEKFIDGVIIPIPLFGMGYSF